jgi:hypothetical protein
MFFIVFSKDRSPSCRATSFVDSVICIREIKTKIVYFSRIFDTSSVPALLCDHIASQKTA